MKLRKLKKHAQEMHGWPNTNSFRTKKDSDWYFYASMECLKTGKLPRYISVRCKVITSNWRSK